MTDVREAREVIRSAVDARVFPAAVVEVGTKGGALWQEAFGRLTFDAEAAPTALTTPFDLASLTKPIATTTVVLDVQGSASALNALDQDVVAERLDEWRGDDRATVTVRDLLEHASGLPARLLDAPPADRREFEHEICRIPLEYQPRTRSIYSDLGFILLAFLVEHQRRRSLSDLFDRLRERWSGREPALASSDNLGFGLSPSARPTAAPTRPMQEDVRRGRRLVGEVHDNYAAALGGVAGHAGLFGTAAAVGAFARIQLRALAGGADVPPFSPEVVRAATARSQVPGSSRALGWDTMLPTSSCGERMSTRAFGHVGFTGTSLWIDPERDRYFVLLTNRVCDGGTLDDMRTVRRAFHDALGSV